MRTFKVLFSNNVISGCVEVENNELNSKTPYCEQKNGQIEFVITKADSESVARSIAKYTVLELRQKTGIE